MSRRFFAVRSISCFALLAALPAFSVLAEDAPPAAAPAKDEPQGDAKAIPEVLVTATRLPEAKEAVGSPVTQISGDDIRQSQAMDFTGLLQGAPGLSVMRTGGVGAQTAVYMRGTESRHTLFLMDGVRIMDPSESTGSAAFDNIMSSDIGQVQILAGPQSPLYGSGAIGGVITGETPQGKGPTSGAASVEGGSRNTWIERTHAGGGDDEFNWYAGVSRYDTDGFPSTVGGTVDDPYRNTSAAVRLGWNVTDVFGVDLIARGSAAHLAFDDSFSPTSPYTNTEIGYVKLAPHLTLADGKWEQVLNLSIFGSDRITQDAGRSLFRGQTLDADWQNTFHVGKELDLVGGVEALRQSADGRASYSDFSAHDETSSAYGQARWNPVERVTLNAGGRVDGDSDYGTHATWRASAAYDSVETNATLRSSVGTGFKAPSLAELHDATSLFGGAPLNNPNLRPETSIGWDAGVDQHFFGQGKDAKLTASGTYFENRIHDMIYSDFVSPYTNITEARTRGVETALAWQIMQGDNTGTLTATGSYTYTDARDLGASANGQLLRRPWNQAALRVDYALPHDAASFGVASRYLGARRDTDPTTFAPTTAGDRFTMDLVARVKIESHVSVYGRIENLFDNDRPEVLGYNPTPFGAFAGVEVKF